MFMTSNLSWFAMLLAAAAWTTHLPALAQTLGLQQAIDRALTANPEIAVADQSLRAEAGAELQSSALPNPELSFLLEGTDSASRTATLQLSQPIELGGKRQARKEARGKSRDIAGLNLENTRAGIRARTLAAFYAVLAAQDRTQLAEDLAKLAAAAQDAADRRVRAGKVAPIEVTRARVAQASVRAELVNAKSALAIARQNLAALMGDATPAFERVDETGADSLHTVSFLGGLQDISATPALRAARAEVARRQALASLERARRIPDVTLSLGVKRDESLGNSQAVVGVSLPIPAFDSNRGNLIEAERRIDQARAELAALEIQTRAEMFAARQKLTSAHAQVQMFEQDVLPGAREVYDVTVKGYQLGKFGLIEVLDAQRTLFEARAQVLNARLDAQLAAAEIERLQGGHSQIHSFQERP
jgi:cobalt-zinc-cadmium efflux system outer membrane protein